MVSIGINTGTVLVNEFVDEKGIKIKITGESAEFARKMASSSGPGKILITESTYNHPTFKKGYFIIEDSYHMQPKETDITTKVREITGMVRGE